MKLNLRQMKLKNLNLRLLLIILIIYHIVSTQLKTYSQTVQKDTICITIEEAQLLAKIVYEYKDLKENELTYNIIIRRYEEKDSLYVKNIKLLEEKINELESKNKLLRKKNRFKIFKAYIAGIITGVLVILISL